MATLKLTISRNIIFVRDFTAAVERMFDEDPQIDIAFQKERIEGGEVNTGFIALRCNERVKAFFKKVSRLMADHRDWNEQKVINDLILNDDQWRNDRLGWAYLPLSFYARTHGWPPLIDAVLYHANCTIGADGVGQKVRQFRKFAIHVRRPDIIVRTLLARAGDAWRRRGGSSRHEYRRHSR